MVAPLRRCVQAAVAALASVCAAAPVIAQGSGDAGAATDPFEDGVVYVEADEVFADPDNNRYVARGDVEARYGERIVRADEIEYYPELGRVIAHGSITVIGVDGSVTYADELELSDDLAEGVIEGFSARLPNQGRIAAAYAVRRDDNRNELSRAFYTACDSCDAHGEHETPTWRLRARRVVQDQDAEMIYYRDAVFEVFGVPVLWTPFMAHPDPGVERRSGFLLPSLGESSFTGFFVDVPYFWAISDHHDVTITPRYMSDANPLVSYDYRRQFFSGAVGLQGSVTREQEFDNGTLIGDEQWRGHIFGEGAFRINDNWSWGFGVERVSDDLYFSRYDIDDADQRRGLYRRGAKRLLSQGYVLGQDDDFFFSAAAMAFQGLRANDNEDEIPVVLPFVEARRIVDDPLFGGRIEARASSAVLERSVGADSRRFTVEADWRRSLTFPNGLVADPFLLLRGDVYSVSEVPTSTGVIDNDVFGRALGYVGADLRYPLGATRGGVDIVVEPVVSVVVSPYGGNDERIPNEDSFAFDLDEATLFDHNRSPGYDVWEEGPRATVGGRVSARWNAGGGASLFMGQSFRVRAQDDFSPVSGLDGTDSDIIGAASFDLNRNFGGTARFRLDESNYGLQRLDLGGHANFGRVRFDGRYLNFDQALASGRPREEARFRAGVDVSEHFSVFYQINRDLEVDTTRRSSLGFIYDDQCTRVSLIYKQDRTEDRTIGEGESIRLQVTLSTLGSFGAN